MTIRRAEFDDTDAILALWWEAEAEPTHTDDAASLARLIARDAEAVIVAEDNGRIIGSVIAGWDGWRGSIYRLVVAQGHRRLKVATTLLHHATTRLANAGAVRSHAIVVASDRPAVAFWAASGWEQQSDRTRFVKG